MNYTVGKAQVAVRVADVPVDSKKLLTWDEKMRRIAIGLSVMAAVSLGAFSAPAATPHIALLRSPVFRIEGPYRSMQGPQSLETVKIAPAAEGEIWVVGYEAHVIDPATSAGRSSEYVCHNALLREEGFPGQEKGKTEERALFLVSQGVTKLRFPAGFGMPLAAGENLSYMSQALNHDWDGRAFDLRFDAKVEYLKADEVQAPLKPLFPVQLLGLVSLEGRPARFADGTKENAPWADHGASCSMGKTVPTAGQIRDGSGQRFSAHWVVPPGRQIYRTPIAREVLANAGASIHYAVAHLHPFAESIALRDVSTGRDVIKLNARNFKDRVGLREVEQFSSVKGVALSPHHEFELVSVYNNTSREDQDAMASMWVYLDRPQGQR